jgi:hypothetical protein
MKVKWYETRKRWQLIIPARFSGTGKKQFIPFRSKSDGKAEIRQSLNRGSSSRLQITEVDEAAFTLAKDQELSPQHVLDAIRLYKQQVLGITKEATLQEAADAFIKYQEHQRRSFGASVQTSEFHRSERESVCPATPDSARQTTAVVDSTYKEKKKGK